MTQGPIAVYYWPTPNGHKITIMLEECGLPYEIKPINIGKGEQFEPSFLAISPNNRMPAIVDPNGPDGKPISVFESGAILQYLGRKIGKFYPRDERARTAVDEWLFWQMGGLGPMAGQCHHFRNYVRSRSNTGSTVILTKSTDCMACSISSSQSMRSSRAIILSPTWPSIRGSDRTRIRVRTSLNSLI